VTICSDCHQRADLSGLTDANPANFTPAGENVLPFHYKPPAGDNADVPDDPCDTGLVAEDKVGSARGLDNDGEGFYDLDDPDCGATAATPGETSGPSLPLLLVTGHDAASQVLSLSFMSGCDATDNKIVFGPVDMVSTHSYTGEECGIGTAGTFAWAYQGQQCALIGGACTIDDECFRGDFNGGPCVPIPDSLFFLVVGQDAIAEGSHGTDAIAERPNKLGGACWLPQDLARRCD